MLTIAPCPKSNKPPSPALISSCIKISPSGIHPHIDKIAFWIERPFDASTQEYITSQCGPGGHDLDVPQHHHRARFDPRLIQRVETRQPSDELIEFLQTVDGLFFNMAEFALDLIFENEEDRDRAFELVDRYIIKKNHRDKGVRYYKGTRYTDPRWAPTNLVAYRPSFSKATGELWCLHLEWRVCGVAALRRLGIKGVGDLIGLDHHMFWKPRLLLREFKDLARLGRVYSNGMQRKKKRKSTPHKPRIVHVGKNRFEYHVDRRIGQMLLRICETTQGLVDFAHQQKISVGRCMNEIENELLLPMKSRYEKAKRTFFNEGNGIGAVNAGCLANKKEGR